MELKKVEIDIGSQEIELFDANPYELVISLSKKAREFNSKALKYLGPETEIKPISVVLDKLYSGDDIKFTYEKEEKPASKARVRAKRKTAPPPAIVEEPAEAVVDIVVGEDDVVEEVKDTVEEKTDVTDATEETADES